MLNRQVYLSEIERIMDIRCGRGHWCYYAARNKGGFQTAVCGEEDTQQRLLEGELFFSKSITSAENEAHELNRTRLGLTPDETSIIIAKYMALVPFRDNKGR